MQDPKAGELADVKDRLKTVQELLTNAKFIRTKASAAAGGEASQWEQQLEKRQQELEKEVVGLSRKEKPAKRLELAHV